MYCKHCGKYNGDNVFCCHCGKRVNPTRADFNNRYKETINAYTVEEVSISGRYLIGDLGVGFVILNEKSKKLVVDTLFEDVFTEGRRYVDSILVKKNGKWGLINPLTGNIICDFIYDDISQIEEDCYDENGVTIVYSNGFCGKIDCDGNIILPIIYDDIISDDRVKYQGLWGVVTTSQRINDEWSILYGGRIILEFEYDEINYWEDEDCYVMRKGDKWGSKTDEFRFPCEFSLKEIKRATIAYYDDSHWTLYAENGRKIYLAFDEGEVSCYTQIGDNKPQRIDLRGYEYLGNGYPIKYGYPIMYSHRYGNNIFLVGDIVPEPNSNEWICRFYISKINAENFDFTYIGDGAAVHFEKDGFKVASSYFSLSVHDSHYDINGEKVREDIDEYQFKDMVYYYGESLVNAQKIVARGFHQVWNLGDGSPDHFAGTIE